MEHPSSHCLFFSKFCVVRNSDRGNSKMIFNLCKLKKRKKKKICKQENIVKNCKTNYL